MSDDDLEDPAVPPEELAVTGDHADDWTTEEPVDSAPDTLEALHEVTRSLVTAENRTDVCRKAVSAAENVLELPLSASTSPPGNAWSPWR